MKQQAQAYLYAGLAIFFWSTVATAFKLALRDLNYIQLVLFSTLVSWGVYALFLLVQGQLSSIAMASPRQWLTSAFLGLLNPFLYYIILFKAYSLLPAQVAQPVNMIWPIVLVFLSVPLLKQKVSPKSVVALLAGFIGVWLISSQGNISSIRQSNPLGLVLALSSSLIWSLYWIYHVKDSRTEETKLFLNFFFATFYILVLAWSTGNLTAPSIISLVPAAYVGLFEMGLTFLFWLKAMQMTRSNDLISTLVYLAPFLSLLFIHFILGEHIYFTTIIGLLCIVCGILYQKISFRSKSEPLNEE
jgi:drug/metabolite transporter (DMT)-like permease